MKMKKKLVIMFVGIMVMILLSACTEADTVSHNLSKSADSFEVQRRVVFFNGITDKYLLTIEGLCSINVDDAKKIAVTCKVGDEQYKKHYLGLSDNVSYFVEQTDAKYEDPFHYKVLFRPESIVPDIDLQTSK
jgi:maltose-binding protein MalE